MGEQFNFKTSGGVPFYRDGDFIYIGEYPQTLKTEDVIIDESVVDERGYYLGSDGYFYAKLVAIHVFGNPIHFLSGEEVVKDNTYYFKVLPIRWRIICNQYDEEYTLVSEDILDCHEFSKNKRPYYNYITNLEPERYNGYSNSDLRVFLNQTFLKSAFSEEEQQVLLTHKSLDLKYEQDRVTLLSTSEVKGNFDTNITEKRRVTDYAIARGMQPKYGYGEWWFSTPYDVQVTTSYTTDYINVEYMNVYGQVDRQNFFVRCGVVPRIKIRDPRRTPTVFYENSYVCFGEYPQTLKADDVIVYESMKDSRDYYLGSDGCYYAKAKATPYKLGYCFKNGEQIQAGKEYYFKVEPIRYHLAYRDQENNAFLISKEILFPLAMGEIDTEKGKKQSDTFSDDMRFISFIMKIFSLIEPKPRNIRYQNSNVRFWLNKVFEPKVLTPNHLRFIHRQELSNNSFSTGFLINKYAGPTLWSTLFLPSYMEISRKKHQITTEMRKKGVSDYARALGMEMTEGYGNWWLRSPHAFRKGEYRIVDVNGECKGSSDITKKYGVVPAFWLRKDT